MSIMDMLAQAAPPQPQPQLEPEPGDGDGQDHSTFIRDILEQVRQAAAEADDDQESLTWEKISTLIQGILAAQQKQDQDMLQGKLPPGALQRVLGG